jgi:DNA-directed RNA polymerase subunit RPC12/RpoP
VPYPPNPSVPRRPFARSASSPRPAPQPNLKVLVAGVERDARAPVEVAVRQAFAGRDLEASWSVSLVRLGPNWSVTLSGPGERFRHLSFVAEQHRLEEAIREVITADVATPAAVPSPSSSAAAGAGQRAKIEERHVCARCKKELRVTYEGEPGEPKESAPVACPHCWGTIHVEIGTWAVVGGDYSADKL